MAPRRTLPVLLLLAASLLAASPVLVRSGWPQNHDGLACFHRVETFRRAFANGNFLPLWAPLAEHGYGSPFPFFYHRLFNSLAGAAALATGSPYAAVKVAVPLLLFAGALGMRRALLGMGLGSFLASCGALLLIFSNYAYTDWVVRGAFAEFTAFMLVPWLTLAALPVVQGKPHAGWALGAVLSLMFFAHSVLFLFSFALVFVAVTGALLLSNDRRRALGNVAQAALVVLFVTGPFLLGIRLFGEDLDLDRQRSGMFSVFRNFVPLDEYLYDRVGGWASSTAGYSVEIGRGFNTLALVSFATVGAAFVRRRLFRTRVRELLPAWFLVLGAGLLYFVLQLPLSAPLYRLLPPMQFLQFPWRLLAFSTPASIFVLCLSLDLLVASRPSPKVRRGAFAALLLAVLFQVYYGVGRPRPGRIYSVAEIETSLAGDSLGATAGFDGAFRPRGVPLPPPRPFLEATGCAVEHPAGAAALPGAGAAPPIRLDVDAVPGGTLVINQFANPFLAVSVERGGRIEATEWGTIRVLLPAGKSVVVLRSRGLLAALKHRLFESRP